MVDMKKRTEEDNEDEIKNYDPMITTSFAYLYGPITLDSVTPLIKFIISCNVNNPQLPCINLLINSHGGDMEHAFALIATIKTSLIPVNTIAIGAVSSAGLMIAMAGHTRYINKYTGAMSHLFSMGHAESTASELKYKHRDVNLTIKRMIDYYSDCTGLPRQKIRRSLLPNHDVYLTSEQCISMHLFDEMYESLDQIFDPTQEKIQLNE